MFCKHQCHFFTSNTAIEQINEKYVFYHFYKITKQSFHLKHNKFDIFTQSPVKIEKLIVKFVYLILLFEEEINTCTYEKFMYFYLLLENSNVYWYFLSVMFFPQKCPIFISFSPNLLINCMHFMKLKMTHEPLSSPEQFGIYNALNEHTLK